MKSCRFCQRCGENPFRRRIWHETVDWNPVAFPRLNLVEWLTFRSHDLHGNRIEVPLPHLRLPVDANQQGSENTRPRFRIEPVPSRGLDRRPPWRPRNARTRRHSKSASRRALAEALAFSQKPTNSMLGLKQYGVEVPAPGLQAFCPESPHERYRLPRSIPPQY